MTATPNKPLVEQVAIALCSWLNGTKRPEQPEAIWDGMSDRLKAAYRDQAQAALDACHAEETRVVLEIMHGGMLCLHSVAPEDMKAKMQEYADVALALLAKLDGQP